MEEGGGGSELGSFPFSKEYEKSVQFFFHFPLSLVFFLRFLQSALLISSRTGDGSRSTLSTISWLIEPTTSRGRGGGEVGVEEEVGGPAREAAAAAEARACPIPVVVMVLLGTLARAEPRSMRKVTAEMWSLSDWKAAERRAACARADGQALDRSR